MFLDFIHDKSMKEVINYKFNFLSYNILKNDQTGEQKEPSYLLILPNPIIGSVISFRAECLHCTTHTRALILWIYYC